MKIHDFGMWFWSWSDSWSTTIPKDERFVIYYDGYCLGAHSPESGLDTLDNTPHTIKYKEHSSFLGRQKGYKPTLGDFEVIPNPAHGLVQGTETPGITTMFLKNLRDAIVNRLSLVKRFVMRRLQ